MPAPAPLGVALALVLLFLLAPLTSDAQLAATISAKSQYVATYAADGTGNNVASTTLGCAPASAGSRRPRASPFPLPCIHPLAGAGFSPSPRSAGVMRLRSAVQADATYVKTTADLVPLAVRLRASSRCIYRQD